MDSDTKEVESSPIKTGINDSIRENLVNTAVQFLQNPNTQGSSLQMKREFLKKKGLTEEEINLAVQRSGVLHLTQQSSSVARYGEPMVAANTGYNYGSYQVVPFQPQPSRLAWARDVTSALVALGGAAYLCYWICKTYIEPYLFGRKKKEVKKTPMELEVSGMRDCVERMSVMMERLERKVDTVSNRSNSEEQEMLSQLNSLKGLLLNRKQFPGAPQVSVGGTSSSIPAWQLPEDQSAILELNDDNDKATVGSATNSSMKSNTIGSSENSFD